MQTLVFCLPIAACGDAEPQNATGPESADEFNDAPPPIVCEDPAVVFAQAVDSFEPGLNAGYGQIDMPNIVLGPPAGHGIEGGGSMSVVSLGIGGSIVFSFGEYQIENGEGVDFSVFENPFLIGRAENNPYAELAEVSVSQDGLTWFTYPCDTEQDYPWRGCAGWSLVESFGGCEQALTFADMGGDGFDLEELSLEWAKFVRIRDLALAGAAPSAGFDADGVGLINWGL